MHWLAHFFGLDNASGPVYLFWSGPFADVPILVALGVFLRHRNCHVAGCRRLGRFPVDGTAWVVCARHHPGGAPSASELGGTQ